MSDDLAQDRGDGRKAHYGAGKQPLDDIIACGWFPHFAAGNVLKYLRRDKSRAHSIESARFYYGTLLAAATSGHETPASRTMDMLHTLLTDDELALIAGAHAP